MKAMILARRYARAIFDLSAEDKKTNLVFAELRALSESVNSDGSIAMFFSSPLFTKDARMAIFEKANLPFSDVAKRVAQTLIKKNRVGLLPMIVDSLENLSDEANGVRRGLVRSATALGASDRQRVEQTVEKVVGKKVILNYKVDPALIGGVTAEVGSLVIDDTVFSHLNRLTDHLNRRAH